MATEYAASTSPYIEYGGTNSQEIRDALQEVISAEVSIDSADLESAVFTYAGGAGMAVLTVPTGYRLGIGTSEVVSPADWAAKYAHP